MNQNNMRIKLPKSEESVRSFLGPALDPDIIKKLHESRQKVNYYHDLFELEQLEKVVENLKSEGRDEQNV